MAPVRARRHSVGYEKMQPMGKRSTTIFFAALSLVATMLPAASEPMRPLREITQTMELCYAARVKFQTESETNGLTKAHVDWKTRFSAVCGLTGLSSWQAVRMTPG